MIHMCYILQYGNTALHMAEVGNHLEIASLLINNGCDINIANKVSYTIHMSRKIII